MDYEYADITTKPTMRAPDSVALARLGQYDVLEKLGGGGYGVVYLSRDSVSGMKVALKTLHPLLKSNPEELENLKAKFAMTSRLLHQNIAASRTLYRVETEPLYADDATKRELRVERGDFVMVMTYAPGVTLSKWRRQFPGGIVPLDQALDVARQIATGLDYAHSEKVVHRDIKPSNVMVETLPAAIRVRILDFGLAAQIRSSMSRVSSEKGDTSGTRPYMAPEQWLGKKQDGRTDQYALACVIYELLSGAPPFAGVFETGDPAIMANAIEFRSPEDLEGVPAEVNEALRRALAKDPAKRFSSCGAFVDALGAASRADAGSNRPDRSPRFERIERFEVFRGLGDAEGPEVSAAASPPGAATRSSLPPDVDVIGLFCASVHTVRRMRRRTAVLLGALTAAATEEQAVQALDKLANSLRDDFVTANEGRADLKRIEPFFHQSAWGSLHARLAMKPFRSPVEDAIWQLFRMERVFCRPDR